MNEPTSTAEAEAWINAQLFNRDLYGAVAQASEVHRAAHGCTLYPSTPGQILGAVAAASGAKRVLEIGGGYGYGTLWLARGVGRGGRVETIESDPGHAAMITGHALQYGFEGVISVHEGEDAEVLPSLTGPFDLIVYDADIPGVGHIPQAHRLLRRGGTFLVSNLFLGRYEPDHPGLAEGAAFRQAMLDSEDWLCGFAGLKLVAVKR